MVTLVKYKSNSGRPFLFKGIICHKAAAATRTYFTNYPANLILPVWHTCRVFITENEMTNESLNKAPKLKHNPFCKVFLLFLDVYWFSGLPCLEINSLQWSLITFSNLEKSEYQIYRVALSVSLSILYSICELGEIEMQPWREAIIGCIWN